MSDQQPVLDNQVITDHVVEQLGKGRDRKDVIFELCEKLGWSWPQAETFVAAVEQTDKKQIAQKQLPVLLILGVGILVAGLALFAYGGYRLMLGSLLSRTTIGALVTGFGMTCGGAFGTWKAVMSSVGRG